MQTCSCTTAIALSIWLKADVETCPASIQLKADVETYPAQICSTLNNPNLAFLETNASANFDMQILRIWPKRPASYYNKNKQKQNYKRK